LTADAEGDIEEVDGVIRITAIRVKFRLQLPREAREKAERALETFPKGCPAYLSIKDCIRVSWSAELEDGSAGGRHENKF
jgi:uncharacterized OsmC-like protein